MNMNLCGPVTSGLHNFCIIPHATQAIYDLAHVRHFIFV